MLTEPCCVNLLTLSSSPQVTPVPELFLTAVKLSHDNTGARYLHLAREDNNNLFRCVLPLGPACSSVSPSNTPTTHPQMRGGKRALPGMAAHQET